MTVAAAMPWLDRYPPGVARDFGGLPFATIPEMFATSVTRYRDQVAFENFGVPLTYGEVDRLSRDFAAFLQSGRGLARGERVAVMMPNILQYPVVLFGILRAGLVVVSVNPLYTARELEHQLIDSGAVAIVAFEGAAHVVAEVIGRTAVRHVVVTSIGEMLGRPKGWLIDFVLRSVKKMVPPWSIDGAMNFRAALARGRALGLTEPALAADDLAFLQYTGGSTGVSKGAMLLHRHILANVGQTAQFFSTTVEGETEVAVAPLPLYHILALVMNCMNFFMLGSRQVLITNPRDIPRLVRTLRDSGFTFFVGVNTLYNALAANADFARLDFSKVKVFAGGGAPFQTAVADRWKSITGKALIEGYGLTETSGAVSINLPMSDRHSGCAGLPLPGTMIEIRDDDGQALPHGEVGEICVRGPQVMAGYWRRPADTAQVLGADGFLRTGDVGMIRPDGLLRIVDRLKDMILVSGFNVYPSEIEDILMTHPGVAEAAVIGVADARTGEAVKAFVVRRDPALTATAVTDHCRACLTGYKVPHQVEFRDTLPKSPVGKILRRELRLSV